MNLEDLIWACFWSSFSLTLIWGGVMLFYVTVVR